MKEVFAVLFSLLFCRINFVTGLEVASQGWDTLPGGSPASLIPPGNNQIVPRYFQDGKWPAYAWDAPANYHNYGKLYSDSWLFPYNVPTWYNQPDADLFKGTAGYLQPPFYGNSANYQPQLGI
uniref:Secreted protein n=1 Tax=Romanomermis culicivorax TaxID=13658 RepID=A0A915K6I6_ROMCU